MTSMSTSICYGESFEGYSESGVYVDTLITNNGCDSIRTILLTTIPPIYNEIHASACDVNAPSDLSPGVYIDTIMASNGCDSIRTLQLSGAKVYIPNVFSPNLDGINDVFTITVFPDQDFNVEYFGIFDRFGDMVYENTKWPITWHGHDHDGKLFQPGVFAYIFIYRCGGQQVIERGDVTILK